MSMEHVVHKLLVPVPEDLKPKLWKMYKDEIFRDDVDTVSTKTHRISE